LVCSFLLSMHSKISSFSRGIYNPYNETNTYKGDTTMFRNFVSKMQEEQVQRIVLQGAGMIVTLVATQAFAALMNKGIETGIDALMSKMHPEQEVAAG